MSPSAHWTDPELALEPDPSRPVLVTVEYHVPAEHHEEFREVMQRLGRSRRRTGAERWSLYQDAAELNRFVETYTVGSWEEHLRQHYERQTVQDERIQQRVTALADGTSPPEVRHLLAAYER